MNCVLVTGGTLSGLVKGVTQRSVGVLHKAWGRRATSSKIDPYVNTDGRTMSPIDNCGKGILRTDKGTSTGLGSRKSFFSVEASKYEKLYDNTNFVDERLRHRNEVNPAMVERQEKADLSLSANDETEKHMEAGISLAAKDETGKRIEPVDDMRIPMDEREKCSDYKPNRSQLTRSTIPSKEQVKADLVKTDKKESFMTNEAIKNMLPLVFKVISSDMAARISTYPSSPHFDVKSCRSSTDGQMKSNFSPTTVSCGKVHQVFFNFRGEQVRYTIVSHLSDAFQRHGIKFFIDENEERGKDLKHLFVRIEESTIALAIFSTKYPESDWCMDELVMMKKLADEKKLIVIPIFYRVEAGDVGKPKRNSEFGKNFWRLAEDSSGNQIKEWKEALESISQKMGLSFGDKSSEADFVKKIVKEVQSVIEENGRKEE